MYWGSYSGGTLSSTSSSLAAGKLLKSPSQRTMFAHNFLPFVNGCFIADFFIL